MFKSRSGSQGNASAPPQSIEAVRRRARHRLIGASVLVLVGVIGFPLLFDTQPRPISVDIPIEIPAKTTPTTVAKPATAAAAPAPASTTASAPPAAKPAESLSHRDGLSAREEMVERPAKPAAAPVAAATSAPAPEPAKPSTPTTSPSAPNGDAARARALLEGKPSPAPSAQTPAKPATANAERLVVQVGAFSEAAGARQVRQKLEGAGLKTYTHEAKTADGTRIRVRVGPFDNRADADKAAARVKALGLPAAVLTL